MINISFFPLSSKIETNTYISRILQALFVAADGQINVQPLPLKLRGNLKCFMHADIYWLNWFEDLGKQQIIRILVRKVILLLVMKMSRGRIVCVIHNKQSHEIVSYSLSRWFMKKLIRISDNVIVLCDDTIPIINQLAGRDVSYKIHKILHPSYDCLPIEFAENRLQKFTLLFVGMLRPYKNIEMLLHIARKHPEFQFIISGKPLDVSYGKLLLEMAQGLANVQLEFKYNTNEELEHLMAKSSILVLPYHLESSLNSGVAMYAFSKGINVVIPKIGTVTELKNCDSIFHYSYADSSEHEKRLEEKISEAYFVYIHNYKDFLCRIRKVQMEVLQRCSIEATSNQIKESGILEKKN